MDQNIELIREDHIITFKNLFIIFIILSGMFSALSFIYHSFYPLRILYNTSLIAEVILFICFINTKKYSLILLESYLLLLIAIVVSLYLATFSARDSNASTIIAVLCVTPIIFMDKPARINTCIILCFLIQCILAFSFKTQELAISDCVNSFVATTIGIYVGNQIREIKIENYSNVRKFEKERFIDSLTTLNNRNKMIVDLELGSKHNVSITGIIIMDIDFFKQYNDNYGHQEGDRCLKRIGMLLSDFQKRYGLIYYRFGGEEFIAFSYGDEYKQLKSIAERMREEVENLNIEFKRSKYHVVTTSIGFSHHIVNQESEPNALVNIADQALYCAKNAGRNCVMPQS